MDDLYNFQQDFFLKHPSAGYIKEKKTFDVVMIGLIIISPFFLWWSIRILNEIGKYGNVLVNPQKVSPEINTLMYSFQFFLSCAGIGYSLYLLYESIKEPHYYRFIFSEEELLIYDGGVTQIIKWKEINKVIYDSERISIRFNDKSIISVLSVIESMFINDPFPKILEALEQKGIKLYRNKKKEEE